ncbi:hypothetical protein ACLB2K_034201 [Fragaria x ananassa]
MEDLKVYDFGGTYPMQTMDLCHGLGERPIPFRLSKACHSCVITVDSWGELYLLVNPDFTSKKWIRGASFFFKLNLTSKEWEKVEKLNDQAIFYNHNYNQPSVAMLLSTRNLPQLEENSIYYTQLLNCAGKYSIMGGLLYSLETKVSKKYCKYRRKDVHNFAQALGISEFPATRSKLGLVDVELAHNLEAKF